MKPKNYYMTALLSASLLAGCTEAEVLYTRPDTSGPKITFTLPPKVHETIYPITRAGTWGLANEFDLKTCLIYMFEETTAGSGYKYKHMYDLGSTGGAISTPSGQPVLSDSGSQTNGERPFTLTLGSGFTGTSTKRFYFVGNLDPTVAKDDLLGNTTLQAGVTTEDDFKIALQSVDQGYIEPVIDITKPLSLPMYSWKSGKPYLEIDLTAIPPTNKVSMVRSVARFDIVNYAKLQSATDTNTGIVTDFTISKIYLGNVAKKGYVMPGYNATPYAATAGELLSTTIDVTENDTINKTFYEVDAANGTKSSAYAVPKFYLLPTKLNNSTTTIQIEGTLYGQTVIKDVTVPAGATDDILPNRLYRIYITKSSDPKNEITASLKVEDWENEQQLEIAPPTRSISGLYTVDGSGNETLISGTAYNAEVDRSTVAETKLRFYYNSSKSGEFPDLDYDKLKYDYVTIEKGSTAIASTRSPMRYRTPYDITIKNDKKRMMVNVPLTVSGPGGVSTTFTFSYLAMQTGDFAFSNIYWDGTKLTFDTTPSADPTLQKQGVHFKWGSLIGISPTGAWNAMSTKLYVPTVNAANLPASTWSDANYAGSGGNPWGGTDWISIPYCDTNFDSDPQDYDPQDKNRLVDVDYTDGKFKGDICKYLSETGVVKGSWRMPTAYEVMRGKGYSNQLYSYDDANAISNIWAIWGPTPWLDLTNIGTADDGTYELNRGIVIEGMDYFPASGWLGNKLGTSPHFMTGSAPSGPSLVFYFNSSETSLCMGENSRQIGFPVRCVKN